MNDVEVNKLSDRLVFGNDENGSPISDTLQHFSNMLVSGTVAVGKTSFIKSIVANLIKNYSSNEVGFAIYDSKMVDYQEFKKSYYLISKICTSDYEIDGMIENIEYAINDVSFKKHLFIIFDDFSNITLNNERIEKILKILQNKYRLNVHVIIVTTNPTANVVLTDFKTYIPVKVAFRVTSKQISRIILDVNGAETLKVPGEIMIKDLYGIHRINATHLTNDEISEILKNSNEIKLNANISSIKDLFDSSSKLLSDLDRMDGMLSVKENYFLSVNNDELYDDAAKYAREMQKVSASLLCTKYGIGYNRANRIIEQLEKNGIIDPFRGSLPGEILINKDGDLKELSIDNNDIDLYKTYNSKNGDGLEIFEFVEKGVKHSDVKDISIPPTLRPFPKTQVKGGSFSISLGEIHLKVKTTYYGLPSTATVNFNPTTISSIIYMMPTVLHPGYFKFKVNSETKIDNESPLILGDVSPNELGEYTTMQLGRKDANIAYRFIKQISDDTGIPIMEQ